MPALVEPKDIARLLKAIDAYDGDFRTCCALKLLPLLMVRTRELRAAEWTEFDFDDKLWRIPGHKMKMGRDHLVPLSRQGAEILLELKAVTGYGKYLLPGRRSDNRVMSENTVNAALRYMGFAREEMTGHGFRSMASTRIKIGKLINKANYGGYNAAKMQYYLSIKQIMSYNLLKWFIFFICDRVKHSLLY